CRGAGGCSWAAGMFSRCTTVRKSFFAPDAAPLFASDRPCSKGRWYLAPAWFHHCAGFVRKASRGRCYEQPFRDRLAVTPIRRRRSGMSSLMRRKGKLPGADVIDWIVWSVETIGMFLALATLLM